MRRNVDWATYNKLRAKLKDQEIFSELTHDSDRMLVTLGLKAKKVFLYVLLLNFTLGSMKNAVDDLKRVAA